MPKFLRVCVDGDISQGMYRHNGSGSFAIDVMSSWSAEGRHPTPYADAGLADVWFQVLNRENYYFAFPGVLELKKWVYDPNFYGRLKEENLYPHWIEARGYHGWYQSVFDINTVESVQKWHWEEL